MRDLLVHGAELIDVVTQSTYRGWFAVEGGRFVEVEAGEPPAPDVLPARERVDLGGAVVPAGHARRAHAHRIEPGHPAALRRGGAAARHHDDPAGPARGRERRRRPRHPLDGARRTGLAAPRLLGDLELHPGDVERPGDAERVDPSRRRRRPRPRTGRAGAGRVDGLPRAGRRRPAPDGHGARRGGGRPEPRGARADPDRAGALALRGARHPLRPHARHAREAARAAAKRAVGDAPGEVAHARRGRSGHGAPRPQPRAADHRRRHAQPAHVRPPEPHRRGRDRDGVGPARRRRRGHAAPRELPRPPRPGRPRAGRAGRLAGVRLGGGVPATAGGRGRARRRRSGSRVAGRRRRRRRRRRSRRASGSVPCRASAWGSRPGGVRRRCGRAWWSSNRSTASPVSKSATWRSSTERRSTTTWRWRS